MIDQFWDFGYTVHPIYYTNKMDDCVFVPIGVVVDKGIEEHYHTGIGAVEGLYLKLTA